MSQVTPPTTAYETVITEVRIRLHRDRRQEILKAFATITLNDCFAIHNLKIIDGGDRGLFVSMPATPRGGKYQDIAHPINREFRDYLTAEIVEAYYRELSRNGDEPD
jgi:stage V sporulation protein G